MEYLCPPALQPCAGSTLIPRQVWQGQVETTAR